MKFTTGILVLALAWGICSPVVATQNKIVNNEKTRLHDDGVDSGDLIDDYGDYIEQQKQHAEYQKQYQKPQTPANGTASQTQTAPAKPPKPIAPPIVTFPKPSKPSKPSNSSVNTGNTGPAQGATVTLPNGATVHKGLETPKTLR